VKIYPFFIPHEGCPHRCLFCDQHSTSGRAFRPSPEEVSAELDRMLPPCGEGEVAFYGGTFTLLDAVQRDGYLESAAPALRAGRVAGIRVSTRPDALGGDIASYLRERGVTTVELGCQSFSESVLRAVKRGHGPECIPEAVERLRRSGLRIGLQLLPGLPGGDRHEAVDSLEQALALKPDFLRIYPAVVFRGTGLEDLYLAGRYSPPGAEKAALWCADLLWRCRRAGVPVVRMGLQGNPALDSKSMVAAGAYHPAFGQLVRSCLWLRALRRIAFDQEISVRVHPADLSDARGHRRANLEALRRERAGFSIVPDPGLHREDLALGDRIFTLTELTEFT